MALHTNLPIYKVTYDLLDVVTDLAKNMPRDFKQSIGGKISQECVEIVVLIFRANCARDKAPHLGELIERLPADQTLETINSYLGLLRHTDGHHDRAALANAARRRLSADQDRPGNRRAGLMG